MRALVLSGGGSKGAYQLGAIRHLYCDRQFKYDIITGTSVGALNGSFLAQYEMGNENNAYEDLCDMWDLIDDDKIYKKWYKGLLGKLPALWKTSVYDSRPLQELVRKNLDPTKVAGSGKKLAVGAVSITTGKYRIWRQSDIDLVSGVLASSSFPAFLTPIEIDGELWTDAGVQEITPIEEAIRLGAKKIHVINCSPEKTIRWSDKNPTVPGIAMRVIELMSADIARWDYKVTELYNKDDGKIKVDLSGVRPKQEPIENSLDFDPRKREIMIHQGYTDATKATWT